LIESQSPLEIQQKKLRMPAAAGVVILSAAKNLLFKLFPDPAQQVRIFIRPQAPARSFALKSVK
jgi:hypothetical protein